MSEKKYIIGICEVHYYSKGDRTPRRVFCCNFCKAWMCDECANRWDRRLLAASIRKMRGGRSENVNPGYKCG